MTYNLRREQNMVENYGGVNMEERKFLGQIFHELWNQDNPKKIYPTSVRSQWK